MSWFVFAAFIGCVVGYPIMAELVARREEIEWGDREASPAKNPSRSDRDTRNLASLQNAFQVNPVDTSWKGWRPMKVVSLKDESPDCRSFVFRPMDGGRLPRFLGGQYLPIRIQDPITGKRTTRCYSLSSGPSEPNYRITVKRVPGGMVSNLLHDRVKVGDMVDIQMPAGRFHIDLDSQTRPLVLIAAGIGITPMLSMLMHSLELSSTRPVHLFFQLRNSDNAPFLGLLRRLNESLAETESNAGKGLFRLHVWFSQNETQTGSSHDRFGRINATELLSQLGTLNGEIEGDFRICGPNEFMSSLAAGLVDHGIPSARVAYESFGGAAKGVGAIAIGPEDDSEPTAQSSITHQVQFESRDKPHAWTPSNGSLLEFAEDADIEIESSCRSGNCGMCVRHLLEGKVRYSEEPTCDREDDEVVMCVARPDSDLRIDV